MKVQNEDDFLFPFPITERMLIWGSFPIHLMFATLGMSTPFGIWGHTVLCMLSMIIWINEPEKERRDMKEVRT